MNDYIALDVLCSICCTCSDTYTNYVNGNTFVMQSSERSKERQREREGSCAKLCESGTHLHTEI